MAHEIVTQDFYGKPVSFHQMKDESDLWLTAEQAALVLGLKDRDSLGTLFRAHKHELVEGAEYAYAKLAVAKSADESSAQVRRVLIFSIQGIEFFALLVRGEAGRRARRWTVDLRAALRAKQKVIVNPESLMNKIAILEHALQSAHRQHIATLEDFAVRAFEMTKIQASTIASMLGKRGAQKRLEKKLRDEIGLGQKFLPGLDGESGAAYVNRLPLN